MSSFDPASHPRGQARNAGQFRATENSAPTETLELEGRPPLPKVATVTAEDRTRAAELLQALEDAEAALREYQAPEAGVRYADDPDLYGDDDEVPTELVCPWCGGEADIVAVDRAERWTEGSISAVDGEVSFDYDASGDFSGSHYSTSCCQPKPVSLPSGWAEV